MQDLSLLNKYKSIVTEYDIFESEQLLSTKRITTIDSFIYSDILDVEFEENIEIENKLYYIVSTFSGILSGAIGTLLMNDFSLENAHKMGKQDINTFVIKMAKISGYKVKNSESDDEVLLSAIRHLEKEFHLSSDKLTSEFGGGLQHHLRDFTHHPSIIGLLFSILTQFTGFGFGTDVDGNFIFEKLPNEEIVGKNIEEKIFNGTVKWFFHLVSDMDGSNNNPGKGTGIPGPMLSFLKEVSSLPLIKNIKMNYENKDIPFSLWVSKLFNGTYFKDSNHPKGIRFDLRTEIGLVHKSSEPVIFNECIVRGLYFALKLINEIKINNIKTINDFVKLNYEQVLPINNALLNRMLTISTGTFAVSNIITAAGLATIQNLAYNSSFSKVFFLHVNYIGIARFVIAVKMDKDLFKDLKGLFKRHTENTQNVTQNNDYFEFFTLKNDYARILHSLENQKIEYDISKTHIKKFRDKKINWKDEWKQSVIDSMQINDENYFIEDEKQIYEFIKYNINNSSIQAWLYIVALELELFVPYYSLDSKKDYKGIHYSVNYEKDVFCKKQHVIGIKKIDKIKRNYKKYKNKLTNKKVKVITGTAIVSTVTIASGGLILYFAPEVAALLAGETVAGLHGAALASASLAFVGGGSLAAGGLGMAGGTAILTGGGALLGLISSSSISLASMKLFSSKDYIIKECSKLLVLSDYVLIEKYDKMDMVKSIHIYIENQIKAMNSQINDFEEQRIDKKEIQIIKNNLKYLQKCSLELKQLLE